MRQYRWRARPAPIPGGVFSIDHDKTKTHITQCLYRLYARALDERAEQLVTTLQAVAET